MERRRSAERPHREAARGGGREARAALEAERSNDESAAEETFPRASAAARSAPSAAARSLTAAARREICGQGVCGGYQASRRFARSNRGAVKLRSASEKRPVNAMPPSACVSRRKPAFGAAAHRSQKIGGAKALLLIGGAEPEREERRGDTQTDAGTPFPERRDTAGGQTHPTAAHRKRLRAGTAMRECGNPLHPLEHANPGQGHLLQALALAAERYAERRSQNAGKAFRGPRGLGAPQLGQAKSRISAAHVPNSFRLRLGVPVLCRLGTVRPPGSANPRPSQRTFRKRRYSRFLPYTRTVRLPLYFYVCFITLYLSESHASLQGKVIGDMICPSFIPRGRIRLACARQRPVSPYIGTLHNAAFLRSIPSAVSLPIASGLAAPLSGDALLSSGCRRSSRRYPIPPFPSSLFLANRFGTPAVIFIKIRAKHLKSGRNCDTIRNWLRM